MKLTETLRDIPALRDRDKIPPARRRSQWVKTVLGGGVFAAAFLLPKLGFPWQAALGVAGFGAWMASQQLVLTFLKAIPHAIAAIVQALSGKSPNGPEAS